jgi:hypothetical protein
MTHSQSMSHGHVNHTFNPHSGQLERIVVRHFDATGTYCHVRLEPTLVHLFEKCFSNREARSITNNGVNGAIWTACRCRLISLIIDPLCNVSWRKDGKTVKAATHGTPDDLFSVIDGMFVCTHVWRFTHIPGSSSRNNPPSMIRMVR